MGGMQQAIQVLLNITSTRRPVVRINTIYSDQNLSMFITMADTKEGKPLLTKFRFPGKEAPFLLWEKLGEAMVVDDLDLYKNNPLYADPLLRDVPFLSHRSLLRITGFDNGTYLLIVNFWSDEPSAFSQNDLDAFQMLITPMAEELRTSFSDLYPGDFSGAASKAKDGVDKLKMCAGLIPVLRQVEQVAPTDYTVLILGETGVGKEAVADAVHELSARKSGPLIKVNCGAIPETLLDSELFGYEKGAFTGANATRAGYFELANGGTIFLDEIGEMSLPAQVRLLRVLDRGVINRVGGSQPISLNIRIIAATHDNLAEKVRNGGFRKDLWYRLAGYPIEVPPLRKRYGDIPALVNYFTRIKSEQLGHYHTPVGHESALKELYNYDWPGNVRELEHVVERALIRSRGKQMLSFEVDDSLRPEQNLNTQHMFTDWPTLEEMENRYIQAVTRHCRGKMTGPDSASAILGIHYTTLRARMRNLGLPLPRDA